MPGELVRPIYKTVAVRSDRADARAVESGARRANGAAGRRCGRPARRRSAAGAARGPDPNAAPRVNNGVTGDPRPATKEIGKVVAEIGINNTVAEIKKQTAEKRHP